MIGQTVGGKTLYLLLSTGSTEEDQSGHCRKIADSDWDVKNQNKQINI